MNLSSSISILLKSVKVMSLQLSEDVQKFLKEEYPNADIDNMSLEELKQFSDVFEQDIYDAISMETCVNKRLTVGAPGKEAMEQVIAIYEAYLAE